VTLLLECERQSIIDYLNFFQDQIAVSDDAAASASDGLGVRGPKPPEKK
jgi:hypothetical protein